MLAGSDRPICSQARKIIGANKEPNVAAVVRRIMYLSSVKSIPMLAHENVVLILMNVPTVARMNFPVVQIVRLT